VNDYRQRLLDTLAIRDDKAEYGEPDESDCTNLSFHNVDTGDDIHLPCGRKRCPDCGPIQGAKLRRQTKAAFGRTAYYSHWTDRAAMDREIARVKKAHQRAGAEFLYTVVGGAAHMYLLMNVEHTNGRLQYLKDIIDQIVHVYRRAWGRLRRSMGIGRMSRVPNSSREQVGTPWEYVSKWDELHPDDKGLVTDSWSSTLRATIYDQVAGRKGHKR
jgi:hypothetical protein